MAVSVKDYQKKLIHMIRFIEQEGHEKAEEIDTRSDEEFSTLKGQLLQRARVKIGREFARREKRFLSEEKIKVSKISLQYKLQVLDVKTGHLHSIKEQVWRRVAADLQSDELRSKILYLLILEGLCKLLENSVKIRCKQTDTATIQNLLPSLIQDYQLLSRLPVKLSLDDSRPLDSATLGGVWLCTPGDSIMLDNTLQSRVDQIVAGAVPAMNNVLYNVPRRWYK